MGFSGTVKLADLNDFIAPSQACVVNLNGKLKDKETERTPAGAVQLRSIRTGSSAFAQTKAPQSAAEPVKVTLHDCLACSGCVTSAETVLLEQQSVDEFLQRLRQANAQANEMQDNIAPESGVLMGRTGDATWPTPCHAVVVSVSPQSRASLAVLYNLTPAAAFRKLTSFLKQLGVAAVFDLTTARDIALHETAQEFVARLRQSKAGDCTQQNVLPQLASSCPGWVCYAEKTHGDHVLPFISTAKSPQAIQGTLVKSLLPRRLGCNPEALYHVTLMPCYDKKLEASRDDLHTPGGATPEVDCVLTSVEVQQLLEDKGVDLAALPDSVPDRLFAAEDNLDGRWGLPGGAGGYLEYVYRTAAQEVFGQQVPSGPLPMRHLRNADLREVTLEVAGQQVLRCAAAYGFRNIQSLMRKMKRQACEYQYVEVMACPGGCNAGGGQVKAAKGESAASLLERVEAAYDGSLQPRAPLDNPAVSEAYQALAKCSTSVHGASAPLESTLQLSGQCVDHMVLDGPTDNSHALAPYAAEACNAIPVLEGVRGDVQAVNEAHANMRSSLFHTQYHKREKTAEAYASPTQYTCKLLLTGGQHHIVVLRALQRP